MIKITQYEADYLIKNVPTRKLKKTSERKFHGGKSYYVLNDDNDSLAVVAMLRGYKPIERTVVSEVGMHISKTITPAQQLLRDN